MNDQNEMWWTTSNMQNIVNYKQFIKLHIIVNFKLTLFLFATLLLNC